jgi:hypothetical protein
MRRGGRLDYYDALTGTKLWQTILGSSTFNYLSLYGSFDRGFIEGDKLYVSGSLNSSKRTTLILDKETGELLKNPEVNENVAWIRPILNNENEHKSFIILNKEGNTIQRILIME